MTAWRRLLSSRNTAASSPTRLKTSSAPYSAGLRQRVYSGSSTTPTACSSVLPRPYPTACPRNVRLRIRCVSGRGPPPNRRRRPLPNRLLLRQRALLQAALDQAPRHDQERPVPEPGVAEQVVPEVAVDE